ncbi:MAG TPA: MFS transporter, partial [Candidatus Limnocylindrales bacterium]
LQTLPDLIVGLPAGAYADRWDRRRMMLYADLGRALLTALIPLSVMVGVPTMGVVLLVIGPINVLRVVFMAAWTAAVPSLVGRDQIGPATSYIEALGSVGFVLGPGLAGVLAAVVGPAPTLAIDAASFAFSAAMLGVVRRPLRTSERPPARHVRHDIEEGIRFVAGHRVLRTAIALWGLVGLSTSALIPALTYYITIERGEEAFVLGFIISAYSIGYILGSLAGGRLARRSLGPPLIAGPIATGLTLAVIAIPIVPPAIAGLAFVGGISQGVLLVAYVTLRATATPDELLGRVGSVARAFSVGVQPVGMLVGGFLIDFAGGGPTISAMGICLILIGGGFLVGSALRKVTPATLVRAG